MTNYITKALMLTLLTLWLGVFGMSSGYALTLNEAQKLLASDGAANDRFGGSVSISGDTAVIGARLDDGNVPDSGSAYVFIRDGTGLWSEQQKLTSSSRTVWRNGAAQRTIPAAMSWMNVLMGADKALKSILRSKICPLDPFNISNSIPVVRDVTGGCLAIDDDWDELEEVFHV